MTLGEVNLPGAPAAPAAADGESAPARGAVGAGAGTSFSLGAIFGVPLRVPLRGPLTRGGAGVGAFVLAIVTAGALAHVGVRLKGLEVAYDLGRERRIATEMEEQRRRLQIEIGMLKDPRRVIAIARDKLNMGPPAPEAIWRLGAGDQGSTLPLPPLPLNAAPGTSSGASAKADGAAAARSAKRKGASGGGARSAGAAHGEPSATKVGR